MNVAKLKTRIQTWREANHAYLDDALRHLRFVLQRRVLWLRHQWNHDAHPQYQGLVISEA